MPLQGDEHMIFRLADGRYLNTDAVDSVQPITEGGLLVFVGDHSLPLQGDDAARLWTWLHVEANKTEDYLRDHCPVASDG